MNHLFTPGPWVVRTIDSSLGTIETADGEIQIAQTFQLRANDRQTGHRERKANTQLISAVPDLLEVCEKLVMFKDLWLIPEDVPPEHQGEAEAMHHLFPELKAAISKAVAEQI